MRLYKILFYCNNFFKNKIILNFSPICTKITKNNKLKS